MGYREVKEEFPNMFTYEEEESKKIDTLRRYVQDGFLLHGSKSRIDKIEPRQASDIDKTRVARNQFGVYATEDPDIAIVMALMHPKGSGNTTSYYHKHSGESESFKIGGVNVMLRTGYVHVLPRETFKEINHENDVEFVSKDPVTPVAVIEVNPPIIRSMNVTLEGELKDQI